jgi:plastocyanin
VSVAAKEFSLTLSRPLVGKGSVRVELRNNGEDPHNLVVSPEGTHSPLASFSEIDPGTYERRSVTLAPGRYQLWCSLEFHEGLGMSTTLRVQ